MIKSAEDLDVYWKAHELTLSIYKITRDFTEDEKFGLTSQLRRASSSICSNLMEGSHRNNKKEYRQFTGIARGSAGEIKYQLLLCRDLKYISKEQYDELINKTNEISRMLYGLINSLI